MCFLGIGRLALFHIGLDLDASRLVELLPDYNAGDTEEIHVIFRNRRYTPQGVCVFIDFLVATLGPVLQ